MKIQISLVLLAALFLGCPQANSPLGGRDNPGQPPQDQPGDVPVGTTIKLAKYPVEDTPVGLYHSESDVAVINNSMYFLLGTQVFLSNDNGGTFVNQSFNYPFGTNLRAREFGGKHWVLSYGGNFLYLSFDGGKHFGKFDMGSQVYGAEFGATHIFVATAKGLRRRSYNEGIEPFAAFPSGLLAKQKQLAKTAIWAIHIDGNDIFVLSTSQKVAGKLNLHHSSDGKKFLKYQFDAKVGGQAQMASSATRLWVALDNADILSFDKSQLNQLPLAVKPANGKWSQIKARDQVIVAQSKSGLLYYSTDEGKTFHVPNIEGSALAAAKYNSHGFGFSATDLVVRVSKGWVYQIALSQLGAATPANLTLSAGYGDLSSAGKTRFNTIHVDEAGVFAGCEGGLFHIKPNETTATRHFNKSNVKRVCRTGDTLWVGSNGISVIDPKSAAQIGKIDDKAFGNFSEMAIFKGKAFWANEKGELFSSILTSNMALDLAHPPKTEINYGGKKSLYYRAFAANKDKFFFGTGQGILAAETSKLYLINESEPHDNVNDVDQLFANQTVVMAVTDSREKLFRLEAGDLSKISRVEEIKGEDYWFKISDVFGDDKAIYVITSDGISDTVVSLYRSLDQGKTFTKLEIEGLEEGDEINKGAVFNGRIYLAGNGFLASQV